MASKSPEKLKSFMFNRSHLENVHLVVSTRDFTRFKYDSQWRFHNSSEIIELKRTGKLPNFTCRPAGDSRPFEDLAGVRSGVLYFLLVNVFYDILVHVLVHLLIVLFVFEKTRFLAVRGTGEANAWYVYFMVLCYGFIYGIERSLFIYLLHNIDYSDFSVYNI